jgi:hypothetical protein
VHTQYGLGPLRTSVRIGGSYAQALRWTAGVSDGSMRRFFIRIAALGIMAIGFVFTTGAGSWFVGPTADIAGVKAAENRDWGVNKNRFQIFGVHVVGDYALLNWGDQDANGNGVYKRVSGELWKRVMWGGGAVTESLIVQHGASAAVAHQLCSGWPKGISPC